MTLSRVAAYGAREAMAPWYKRTLATRCISIHTSSLAGARSVLLVCQLGSNVNGRRRAAHGGLDGLFPGETMLPFRYSGSKVPRRGLNTWQRDTAGRDGTRGTDARRTMGAASHTQGKKIPVGLVVRTPPGRRLARTETDHCDDVSGSWRLEYEGVGGDVGDVWR